MRRGTKETGGPCGDRLFVHLRRDAGSVVRGKRTEKKTSGEKEEELLDSNGYPW